MKSLPLIALLTFSFFFVLGEDASAASRSRAGSGKCDTWGQAKMRGEPNAKCHGVNNCRHDGQPEDTYHTSEDIRKVINCMEDKVCGSRQYRGSQTCSMIAVSAYRSRAWNSAGMKPGRVNCSQHRLGLAMDIMIGSRGARTIQQYCRSCGARWTHAYAKGYAHCDFRGGRRADGGGGGDVPSNYGPSTTGTQRPMPRPGDRDRLWALLTEMFGGK